jgi:hypothetical protein
MPIPHVGPDQIEVWVIYNKNNGSVSRVCRCEPSKIETPEAVGPLAVFKTTLSELAIGHAHQLQVRNGRIVHAPSLGGI